MITFLACLLTILFYVPVEHYMTLNNRLMGNKMPRLQIEIFSILISACITLSIAAIYAFTK